MISKFFIDRPIFAAVASILIILSGVLSAFLLPISRFPEITPPTVIVSAFYPGASAETVAQAIATPIEQELSGAKNLLYFQTFCGNDGSLRLTATFETGSNIDDNQVEVQNRIKNAEPRLPQEVVRQGIKIEKSNSTILMVLTIKSKNPLHDLQYINGYANSNIVDQIKRVPGVGGASVFGGNDYSMRVWVDPTQLTAKSMTVSDLAAAIREQNGLYAAGRIGAPPAPEGTELTMPVTTRGRLETPEEFADIVLRASPDGSAIRLKDVARVELGAQNYDLRGRQNGLPSIFILVNLQSDANALETSAGVTRKMEEVKTTFPDGIFYELPFDTTPFIRIAIEEVVKTFLEALFLVSIVVLVFLGTWRATLIPLAAVPVAIIGTLTGMLILGFSINSLTLFGLVLAIGIVVDDAIIVVENVERIMHEEHLPVREATIKAMEQVTGPIIAIVLVLVAVFVPVAFLGGLTGKMYQQFAVTIAISVTISGFVALSLSPALAVVLLKKQHQKMFLFRWFDSFFASLTSGYTWLNARAIRYGIITVCVFGAMLWSTRDLFRKVPQAFIPSEDQGYIMSVVMLPPGATLDRTTNVLKEVEDFLMAQPEARSVVTLGGMDLFSGFTPNPNAGLMFTSLTPWDQRRGPAHSDVSVVGRTYMQFGALKEGLVLSFPPPPVMGLGMRAGFEFQLEDRSGGDVRRLAEGVEQFKALIAKRPEFDHQTINANFNVNTPQVSITLDVLRAKTRGVAVDKVYEALQAFLGSLYVNDFVKGGRIYRVQLQAEPDYRANTDQIREFNVRNDKGQMVPLSDLVSTTWKAGPGTISRFNGYTSVQVTGSPAPGYSTGDTIRAIEEVMKEMPQGYAGEWSGSSYQEIRAGNQAPYIVSLGLVVVFLVLAALYERWSLPFVVLLGIPSGAFGAILAVYLRGLNDDIYFQIGLLTLIGLAAKNAILIVEFSAALREQGRGIVEAAVEAARVRLRPFIMTSLAFILGVMPLVLAEGAGANGRHSIGTGVMGGMIAATVLDMFFVPLLFVIFQALSEKFSRRKKPGSPATGAPAPATATTTPSSAPAAHHA